MSKMKDFRNIADEVMKEVVATDELKEKTLKRYKEKRDAPLLKFGMPAACFALFLVLVNIPGVLPLKNLDNGGENLGATPMIVLNEDMGILDETPENISDRGSLKNWVVENVDEAKMNFGKYFLTPAYIPQGFKLEKVYASGFYSHTADKIVLTYHAKERSFIIIEEKTEMQFGYVGFSKIDINGSIGYLKPRALQNENVDNLDTEIHWSNNGIHYSVAGLLKEEEAIKIAKSMK